MSVEYYTPGREELLAAMRSEFAFLVSDYGYVELCVRPEQYINPYAVLYRRAPIEVVIEGISYGRGTTIEIRIREEITDPPSDQFCISWVTAIRHPELQKWEFPEQRGQLVQLPRLSSELRAVADDLLRGDLSILPQIRAAITKARAESEASGRIYEFHRAEARSQEAFRRRDYAAIISELESSRDMLNRSSRKRLEIAKSRLHDTS